MMNKTRKVVRKVLKNKKLKMKVSSFILVVLLVSIVSGVYAWTLHNVDIENTLTSRTVEVSIEEDFPSHEIDTVSSVTKEVSFENTGTASVFLRFTYAEYWETGIELLEGHTSAEYVTKNWAEDYSEDGSNMSSALWYDGGDGWYYYKLVLPAGDSIDILESVAFTTSIPDDADYSLIFQVETVQISDEDSVNTAATELLFGVTGIVTEATIKNGAVISGNVTWTAIGSGGD